MLCVNCGGEAARGACVWCQDWRMELVGRPWSDERFLHILSIETQELGHEPKPSAFWR